MTDLKKYIPTLLKTPLFHGIGESEIEKMLCCLGAKVELFEKRYTVFREGTKPHQIGIVLSGGVQIVEIDFYGNRTILGEIGEAGMFMEEFASAGESTLPFSAIASLDSEIMLINAEHILHTCDNCCSHHRELIYNLMKALARKSVAQLRRSEVVSKRTTREKLLAYLYLESEMKLGEFFEIPFDRQELADYLEVERSGLSTEISKLKREGVIENEKRRFKLL